MSRQLFMSSLFATHILKPKTVRHVLLSTARMSTQRVVVTRILPPLSQAALEKLPNIELIQWEEDRVIPREILLSNIKGADGLLCMLSEKIDKELLETAGPKLKVVSTMSVGFDHVDTAELKQHNIKLGYTPDVLTDATADTTVLLTLAVARRLKESIRAVENGEWGEWRPNWLCGTQFTSKTLGVVGLGRIGEAVAHRLRAFGISRVLYSGRSTKTEAATRLGGAIHVSFYDLLAESDFVIVSCALTAETRGMFNYEAFKRMKRNAIFVNTARGGQVIQDDLIRALQENFIAGAGLDVTTPEPLPTDSPLLSFKNCIVVPHIGSATTETREEMARIAIVNLCAGLKGESLPHTPF
ncbi:glyoxylate reductase [Endogone sp. FLAS-F59071]|nr:glyoxylate reductase [Endogone sp. FLAS-F59071]|eukprot:RUS19161.1 glyoxylate reductase [Endogone sp. FLAS-F59071]